MNWKEFAECKGVDTKLFFPRSASKTNKNEAIEKYCKKCLVSDHCLAEAIASSRVHGIWGGTTQRDRIRMRGW